jgi:hypothetical protein
MTKLSRYCEALIEVGWLAALVLVPLFFDVYSARVFEPDKITLLRSIALVMVAAWLIMQIEHLSAPSPSKEGNWRARLRVWLRTPLVAPALALVAIYVIATIFSVTPRVSFLGSYQRLQGTYTLLSYVTVFAMVLSVMRRQEQVDRLITIVILTSMPISLYGLLQKLNADPLPWGGDVITRIAANMGNAIFIAAYLIMVLPLTVGRVVESMTHIMRDERLNLNDVVRAGGYVIILGLQVLGILFAGSRGPWIGFAAGVFFLGLLLALYWRARWLMVGAILYLVAGIVFLVVLNLPNSPIAYLRDIPYFGRLGQILDIEGGTGKVRVLIWEGTIDLLTPHEPLVFPDGSTDPYNAIRPLIGYGPEAMYVAYNRFYPPDLAHLESRNASPDRAHNETLDALVITGLAGLVIQLFLFGAVFYYGLKLLGLMRTGVQRWLFMVLYMGGGIIGTLIVWTALGERFIGVGLPLGVAIGVLFYLLISAVFFYGEGMAGLSRSRQLIIIVALAAIIAHFVEIHLGIAIAATRLYFWTFSALIVVVGYLMPRTEVDQQAAAVAQSSASGPAPAAAASARPSPAPKRSKRRRAILPEDRLETAEGWLNPTLVLSGFVALLVMVVGFEMITNPPRGSSTFGVLVTTLTTLQREGGATSIGAVLLLFFTWVLCSTVVAAELGRQGVFERAKIDWWMGFSAVLAISGAIAFFFGFVVAGTLASIVGGSAGGLTGMDLVIAISGRVAGMIGLFYFFVFLMIALLAVALLLRRRLPAMGASLFGLIAAPVALVLVYLLVVNSNLNVILADIIYKQAEPYERNGLELRGATDPDQRRQLVASWQAAVTLHAKALDLAPNEDYYYLFLGRAYLELAGSLDDPNQQEELLETARDQLLDAQRINPLNTDHAANLGRLHRRWSDLLSFRALQYEQAARKAEADNLPEQQAAYLQQAADARQLAREKAELSDQHYGMAATLSPHNALLWNEWASLRWDNFQDFEGAIAKYEESLKIDTEYDQTYLALASIYYERGLAAPTRDEKLRYYEQLIPHGEKAIELNPKLARAWDNLSVAYVETGRCQQGITATQTLLTLISEREPTIWNAHRNLAISLKDCGRYQEALDEAQKAYDLAPDGERPVIQQLIDEVRTRMGAS